MCRHAQHQHIGCSHFILTHLLSNNCIRKVVRHHEKLIPAQKAEHRQRLHKTKQLMAGCVRVNRRVMPVFDLAAKPLLAFYKKVFCELWAAPYQALADDPNTIVVGMAGGDLPMGQSGEQHKKVATVHTVIIKKHQYIHILQIKALADFFTERLVHLLISFDLHIPIVIVLSVQRDGVSRTQFRVYNLLELRCQFVPTQVDRFILRRMSVVE